MSHLVLSREIYRPIHDVYTYHSDLTRAPEWWPNLSDVRLVEGPATAPPPQPGARFSFRYTMLGRHFTGTMTVTEAAADERFVFEVKGPVDARFRHDYTATARSRTRVTVFAEYNAHGLFGRAIDRLVVERRNAADAELALDRLKEYLEAEAMARINANVV